MHGSWGAGGAPPPRSCTPPRGQAARSRVQRKREDLPPGAWHRQLLRPPKGSVRAGGRRQASGRTRPEEDSPQEKGLTPGGRTHPQKEDQEGGREDSPRREDSPSRGNPGGELGDSREPAQGPGARAHPPVGTSGSVSHTSVCLGQSVCGHICVVHTCVGVAGSVAVCSCDRREQEAWRGPGVWSPSQARV